MWCDSIVKEYCYRKEETVRCSVSRKTIWLIKRYYCLFKQQMCALPRPPPFANGAPTQLEIAHKKRYHGGSSSGSNSNSSLAGGGGASNGASAAASSRAGSLSLSRPQSPRVIGAVTLAEAKAQLGDGFSILGGGRPSVARAVVAPDQALSALRECTKETDKGIGDAFHLQGWVFVVQ